MNQKTRNLWIIVVAVILVAAAIVAAVFLLGNRGSDQPDGSIKLYWNVEQIQYEDPASGKSMRKENEDGVYTILMAVDGKQEKLGCKDQELVDKIDSASIVGLSLDKDGMTGAEKNRERQVNTLYMMKEYGYLTEEE